MTSEMRTLIELSDVSGIEMECPKCHVKTTFPIAEPANFTVSCPYCNKPWFDGTPDKYTGKNVFPAFESLQAVASHLRALTNTRTDVHALVRLHINTAPKAETTSQP